MKTLIHHHGYARSDFDSSDGTEAVYAPKDISKGSQERGFLRPGPKKGTPLVWYRSSYEYDEWDVTLPSDVLAMIEFDWASAIKELGV
jgi:hypothetical protein